MAQLTRRPRRQIRAKVYELNGLEALGNKASPRERCPRGRGAGAWHRTVQAWMDSRENNSQGRDPRTQDREEHSQLQAEEHNQQAGKKSIANCRQTEGSQPTVRQTTNDHHSYRGPQTQITQQDGRDARQSSTEALTVQTVLKYLKLSSRSSSRKPSRSLFQRRGRLDSKDR